MYTQRPRARELVLGVMQSEQRTLEDPAPAVFVTGAEEGRVTLFASAWVTNADWFGCRDALYLGALAALRDEPSVTLALPRIEVADVE